jgi:DNA polymerase sigma
MELQLWCVEVAERRRRLQLKCLWEVASCILSCVPAAEMSVFGSFVTGLAVPSSDIDLLVYTPGCGTPGTSTPQFTRHFHWLVTALRQQQWVTSVTAIPSAMVPVIKVVSKEWILPPPSPAPAAAAVPAPAPASGAEAGAATGTGVGAGSETGAGGGGESETFSIQLDITFSTQAHRGHRTTQLAGKLLDTNPPLAPLVLFLKQLLGEAGLNDAFTGGRCSRGAFCVFVFLCLVVFPSPYLQLGLSLTNSHLSFLLFRSRVVFVWASPPHTVLLADDSSSSGLDRRRWGISSRKRETRNGANRSIAIHV